MRYGESLGKKAFFFCSENNSRNILFFHVANRFQYSFVKKAFCKSITHTAFFRYNSNTLYSKIIFPSFWVEKMMVLLSLNFPLTLIVSRGCDCRIGKLYRGKYSRRKRVFYSYIPWCFFCIMTRYPYIASGVDEKVFVSKFCKNFCCPIYSKSFSNSSKIECLVLSHTYRIAIYIYFFNI